METALNIPDFAENVRDKLPHCPKCKVEFGYRVRRGFILKQLLNWLPVKRILQKNKYCTPEYSRKLAPGRLFSSLYAPMAFINIEIKARISIAGTIRNFLLDMPSFISKYLN